MTVAAAVLATFGVILVAVGAGLIWLPAGLIAGGLLAIAGAYVVMYLHAKTS